MRARGAAIFFAILLIGCTGRTKSPTVSECASVPRHVERILAALAVSNISETTDWPTSVPSAQERLVHVSLPCPRAANDVICYGLTVDEDSGLFWVVAFGGIGGMHESRGPARLDETGSIAVDELPEKRLER